jgi:hypothetical protein
MGLQADGSIINMHETQLGVFVNSEVRDPGQTVWSTHQGQFACSLGDLQALLSALGHGQDLFVEAADLTEALLRGDLSEEATLLYVDEDDRKVEICLQLA